MINFRKQPILTILASFSLNRRIGALLQFSPLLNSGVDSTQKQQAGRTTIIKYALFLLLFNCLLIASLWGQQKITGIVTGRDNLPLVGATVTNKSTNIVTLTISDGSYAIVAKKGDVLVISFIGHKSRQIEISDNATINISLEELAINLDEVLLTGYTTQKVKEITGSVAIVKTKDLTAVPVGQVDEMLQGRAAGLTVISSGLPGGASNIRINGIGNFGDVTPLYIIDGVQGDINALNPYDIESMQVLKDAGAYSIYGVRAANGVIIITTRKGKNGKSSINFDAYTGYQVPLKNGFNVANSQGQADLIWMAYKNSGVVDPVTGNPVSSLFGNGPVPILPDYYVNDNGYPAGAPEVDASLYNISPGKPIYQIMKFNKAGTDWFHELFKPAWNQNYTVSASGGNEKNRYMFSLGYLDQQGTYLNSYLKKFTARVNTSFNISNSFRIGDNLQLNQSQLPMPSPQIDMENFYPWLPVYDIKGNWSSNNANTSFHPPGPADNPVGRQQLAKYNSNKNWQILGNAYAELDFLKHFTLRSSFGGTYNFFNNYMYNYGAYDTASGLSQFNENTGYASSWTWTNTLTFSEIFAEKHHLKVLVGTENINNYSRQQSGTSEGYFSDDPNLRFLGNGNNNPADQTVNSSAASSFLSSFISSLEYGFDDKYFLSATLRSDASSVFSAEHRVGWFPSVSAAWRINREKFMNNIEWLTEFKLRGSWGISGYNGNVDPYNQYTLYSADPRNSFYSIYGSSSSLAPGIAAVRLGNAKTGWQQDYMTNIGFESNLWNGKLTVTADWYNKKSTGLLFPLALPAIILGIATPPNVNIGDIQNTGINLTLGSKGNFSKKFSWNFNVALTSYKTRVLKLNDVSYFDNFDPNHPTGQGSLVRNEVGYPIGSFFGYKIIGFFKDASDVIKSPVQESAAPGRFKYLDANKDGIIDPSDRVHYGDPNPKFTLGINIGFSFKQFDFSTFSYWSYGNDVLNIVKNTLDIFPATFSIPHSVTALNDSWTPTHQNAKAPIVEINQNFSNNGQFNSYPMEKGTYFRNKTMMLGYTLPAGTLQKFKIEKFRVYAEVVNLFTITKYSGLDPELSGSSSAFGIDYGNYPNNQRQYLLGINMNF